MSSHRKERNIDKRKKENDERYCFFSELNYILRETEQEPGLKDQD